MSVWVDATRCTGCGACVEVCPNGAITLTDGLAYIDDETCVDCGTCIGGCPEGAIQLVVQGELVSVQERRPPAIQQPSPLAETVGAAVVTVGAGLLMRGAGALTRALVRWITADTPREIRRSSSGSARSSTANGTRRGRRARHRRRGS